MIRLLIIALFTSLSAYASYETLVITHIKVYPFERYTLGAAGDMEVVGSFDTATTDAEFQYRLGEGDWVDITTDGNGKKISKSRRSLNYRKWNFHNITNTSVEIRACFGGVCSVPYLMNLLPEFSRVLLPKTGVVTAMNRNLRFILQRHVYGMRFYIGKMFPFPENDTIWYSPKEEVFPIGNCPGLPGSDPFACEIFVPDSIIKEPGTYFLTGTSPIGSSVNYLKFEVQSVYKILQIVPDRIRFHVQDVLTFNFAGGIFRPRDIDITMLSCNRRLTVTPGRDMYSTRIPPECMPTSGQGDLILDVRTPGGIERVSVPYDI
jgi:hypothetical protein